MGRGANGAAPPTGVPRSYLRGLLLLLIAEGSAHGYDLLEQIQELGMEATDPGGVYRCLRIMERERLVTSHWEKSPSGPARRTYELTAAGRDWLRVWAAALGDVAGHLHQYLDRYRSLTGPALVRGQRPA